MNSYAEDFLEELFEYAYRQLRVREKKSSFESLTILINLLSYIKLIALADKPTFINFDVEFLPTLKQFGLSDKLIDYLRDRRTHQIIMVDINATIRIYNNSVTEIMR